MLYRWFRQIGRVVMLMTIRVESDGCGLARRQGGYVLACCHVSHLDPVCVSAVLSRKIEWLARSEFYTSRALTLFLHAMHAVRLQRVGVPVRAMKTAIARLNAERVIGIFPEGELRSGAASALRGGAMKKGAAFLACRTGKPIVPCIVLGTEKLNRVGPWLPFRRGRIWIACGEAIEPVSGMLPREARAILNQRLQSGLISLYASMRERHALADDILP